MKSNRLRVLRAEHDGISQREVAQKAGIEMTRYWKIENGYSDPTPAEVKALVRAFRGATVEDLFPTPDAAKVGAAR